MCWIIEKASYYHENLGTALLIVLSLSMIILNMVSYCIFAALSEKELCSTYTKENISICKKTAIAYLFNSSLTTFTV